MYNMIFLTMLYGGMSMVMSIDALGEYSSVGMNEGGSRPGVRFFTYMHMCVLSSNIIQYIVNPLLDLLTVRSTCDITTINTSLHETINNIIINIHQSCAILTKSCHLHDNT